MFILISKFFTPKGFNGITIFPFVILRDVKNKMNLRLINHEKIHIRQQLELLVLPFFIWYLVEYLFRLYQFKDRNKAYRNIVFEREAYENEKDLNYLQKRSFWNFLRYY